VAGWPLRWRAAAMARWRTASGLRAGIPSLWRVNALRSDGQVVPNSAAAALTPTELLGHLEGPFGFAAVGQERPGGAVGRRQTRPVASYPGHPLEESSWRGSWPNAFRKQLDPGRVDCEPRLAARRAG
jgi:hypothetical protein